LAWYLICSAKKGISSLQLQRQLKLGSYRTALFMAHRIRYALKSESFAEKMTGTIEVDETFVGGTKTGVGGGSKKHLTPVVAMVQRGGEVRSQVMPTVNGANLRQAIRDNVQICAEVHTDANYAYRGLESKFTHKSVKHCAGEYSRHEGENVVTTASVESFFSLLKRGVVGTCSSLLELWSEEAAGSWPRKRRRRGIGVELGFKKKILKGFYHSARR
jgi:hypothetical protein